MSFTFLPDKQEKPNTSSGTGGSFSVGKNVFIDKYLSHLDAHKLFSTPPLKSEFKLVKNYDAAQNYFNEENINSNVRDNFYGKNTTFDNLVAGYTQFQNPKLLNDVLGKVDANISSDLFSGIEKPKMKINDRFGMFSFDLASMAMTYVYEYLDKKGNIVNANFVEKINGKYYFQNIEVTQRIKRRENGNPYVVSSVRNCLIDFEKQKKQERSVEILVLNAFSADEKAEEIIFNSMAAIAVAKNLILKGFKVKLTGIRSITNPNTGTNYIHFIPVKRFNQPLDINAAAYVLGDARFYRYQGFKLSINGCDENGEVLPLNLGYTYKDKAKISKDIETEYVPNSGLTQADTRLYFGGSRNLDQVKNEVKEALTILNQNYGKN